MSLMIEIQLIEAEMAKKTKVKIAESRGRKDDRRQILLYMREDLIKRLKGAAVERRTTAWSLAEQAVEEYLARTKAK
jgi:hypothetical protein